MIRLDMKKFLLPAAILALGACGDESEPGDMETGGENGGENGGECTDHDIAGCFDNVITRTQSVFDIPSEAEVANSEMTLVINTNNDTVIGQDVEINGVATVGNVYSLWWVLFNDGSECTAGGLGGALCNAPDLMAGMGPTMAALGYVGSDSVVADSTDLAFPGPYVLNLAEVGDTDPNFLFGPGLTSLEEAEIHLIVQNHGPALTGDLLEAQFTQFNGGCQMGEPNEGMCSLQYVTSWLPIVGQ